MTKKRNFFSPFINLAFILICCNKIVFAAETPDRFAPLSVGPHHFFYFSYPIYVPDSARVREVGSFALEFEYTHANLIGKSVNYGVSTGYGNYRTGKEFEFKYCGYYINPEIKTDQWDYEWNCKARGYSIVQDGETLRRGIIGKLGLGMHLELQLSKRDLSFRGGELDHFIENFHKQFNFSNTVRNSFPRNQFGIYIWDNANHEFVYQLDAPPRGFQPESKTVVLKLGLIQGDHLAVALRYATNFNNRMLRMLNQIESQRYNPKDQEDQFFATDLNWIFENWAIHLGNGQTHVARRFLPLSPKILYFQFYAVIGRVGDDSEWMFQDLTYTSFFPKDGRETLQEPIRERTLGMRIGIGEHFNWEFGLSNNITWGPQNIDSAFFSRFNLAF